MSNTYNQMEAIKEALELAKKHNLETEVMCWAMKNLKANPKISIEEALRRGLKEWDLGVITYEKTFKP